MSAHSKSGNICTESCKQTNKQQTANKQTTNSKQQTTNNKQQTTNNKQQTQMKMLNEI